MEEQNNNFQEPKKKGNGLVVALLVIVIILLIGIGVLIVVKPAIFNFSAKSNDTASGVENVDDTTTSDEIKELDLSKGIGTDYVYSNPVEAKTVIGVSVKGENTKSPKLVIDWKEFGPHSGASAWGPEPVEYEIKGFTKNVKYGVVGEVGQSAVSTTVFYLMEDGTVEYTKLFVKNTDANGNTYYSTNYIYEKDNEGKITGEHFETQGSVSNVKNVVKFYNVDSQASNTAVGGARTTIGATKDGSFYDLGNIINK